MVGKQNGMTRTDIHQALGPRLRFSDADEACHIRLAWPNAYKEGSTGESKKLVVFGS